ncbi:hypothetical protein [Engelhardtia mirabilis]|uniref:Right handed beta helix domain-containing protein n=1 Tax=Engelhardtia mirabilis TaxID=2528011 RepID=A0A518BLR2_9BACT|nr:hypothetical protein Pla133_30030 [Planctomycetes bacterium Pla133]QDV02240.1 hypothetical protein Pla86_30020 [Planctomycetes bacterium Pla86]
MGHRLLHCALPLVLVLASTAGAQSVWTVDDDPGAGVDFSEVQAAVDAAAIGDLVLVREGVYLPFSIDGKGLSVVGDGPGVKLIQGPPQAGGTSITNLPVGQLVLLRGLRLQPLAVSGGSIFGTTLDLDGCLGSVWVEECELPTSAVSIFGDLQQITALGVTDCDEVFLVDCLLQGQPGSSQPTYSQEYGSRGATFRRCTAYLYDCVISPGYNDIVGNQGQTGVLVEDSLVVMRACQATGGVGGPGGGLFLPVDPGNGGVAVEVQGSSELYTIGSTLTGGPGGTDDFSMAVGDEGEPLVVQTGATYVDHSAHDANLTVPAIVRSDDDVVISITTDPFSSVFLLVALGVDGQFLSALPDAVAVGLGPILLPLAPTGASGSSSFEIGIPILPPGLVFTWVLQAAVVTPTTGLELSEPSYVNAIAVTP